MAFTNTASCLVQEHGGRNVFNNGPRTAKQVEMERIGHRYVQVRDGGQGGAVVGTAQDAGDDLKMVEGVFPRTFKMAFYPKWLQRFDNLGHVFRVISLVVFIADCVFGFGAGSVAFPVWHAIVEFTGYASGGSPAVVCQRLMFFVATVAYWNFRVGPDYVEHSNFSLLYSAGVFSLCSFIGIWWIWLLLEMVQTFFYGLKLYSALHRARVRYGEWVVVGLVILFCFMPGGLPGNLLTCKLLDRLCQRRKWKVKKADAQAVVVRKQTELQRLWAEAMGIPFYDVPDALMLQVLRPASAQDGGAAVIARRWALVGDIYLKSILADSMLRDGWEVARYSGLNTTLGANSAMAKFIGMYCRQIVPMETMTRSERTVGTLFEAMFALSYHFSVSRVGKVIYEEFVFDRLAKANGMVVDRVDGTFRFVE